MAQTIPTPLPLDFQRKRTWINLRFGLALAVVLLLTIAVTWLLSRTHVTDLGVDPQMTRSGAYAQWAKGNVILMVRHAERCDQSDGACLGPADGITLAGSRVAQSVGQGLEALGLSNAVVLASPLTRTQQTAAFMFGKQIESTEWLHSCDGDFAGSALANKPKHQNMVLVTHSGCIDHFLRKLKVQPGERETQFAEAILISVNDQGRPSLLGSLKADEWAQLTAATRK